jgi:hypothetical protein
MLAILYALGTFVADLCKSRSQLEAENVFLRHQLNLAFTAEAFSHSTAGQRPGVAGLDGPTVAVLA